MIPTPRASHRHAFVAPVLILALATAAGVPARAAVVERFGSDPLAAARLSGEGDVAARFTFLPDEPPHFPGDRQGTLRVLYDTTLPAARVAAPLEEVLSLQEDFAFGAILTIRSESFRADPEGFSQIAFGLWNGHTTGMDRTGFPADSFDLVEFDYFANAGPFGGPFLSPTVFGGAVGENAFFNFAFQSSEVRLPLDTPLLCQFRYAGADRALSLTVSRPARGPAFTPVPGASVTVDLSRLDPTFLVDAAGIAAYFEGWPSLHAVVDYDLLYTGALPAPFGVVARRSQARTRTNLARRLAPAPRPPATDGRVIP